jgi:hypothetical protein
VLYGSSGPRWYPWSWLSLRCVAETAVERRGLGRVVRVAQGHEVVVVVAAWPVGAEPVDVVDVGGRAGTAVVFTSRVVVAVLAGLGSPAPAVPAG